MRGRELVTARSLTRAAALSTGLLGWLGMQWLTVKLFEHSHLTAGGPVTHHHPYAPSALLVAAAVLATSLVALAVTGPARHPDVATGRSPRTPSVRRGRGLDWHGTHVILAITAFLAAETLEHRSLSQFGSSATLVALGALAQALAASAGWWVGMLLAGHASRLLLIAIHQSAVAPTWHLATTPWSQPTRMALCTSRTSRGPPSLLLALTSLSLSTNQPNLSSAHAAYPAPCT
jgi:hypothetical protein